MVSGTSSNLALTDRFEILKDIGDGSFGSVVLAKVRSAGAGVARRGSVVCVSSLGKNEAGFLLGDTTLIGFAHTGRHQDDEEDF